VQRAPRAHPRWGGPPGATGPPDHARCWWPAREGPRSHRRRLRRRRPDRIGATRDRRLTPEMPWPTRAPSLPPCPSLAPAGNGERPSSPAALALPPPSSRASHPSKLLRRLLVLPGPADHRSGAKTAFLPGGFFRLPVKRAERAPFRLFFGKRRDHPFGQTDEAARNERRPRSSAARRRRCCSAAFGSSTGRRARGPDSAAKAPPSRLIFALVGRAANCLGVNAQRPSLVTLPERQEDRRRTWRTRRPMDPKRSAGSA